MIETNPNKIYKWGIIAVIAIFSIFLLYLNFLFPLLVGDDFLYQLVFPDEGQVGNKKISSLLDLVTSTKNHYHNYNPRVLPHAALQLSLTFLSPLFLAIINTGLFVLLPLILLKFANKTSPFNYWATYVFVLFFIWVFHFDLGRAYFWKTGSVNYFWFIIPQLLIIYEFINAVKSQKDCSKKTIFLALLICTTNENVVLSLFLVFTYFIFQNWIKNKILFKNITLCATILLAGGLIMFLSPSLQERMIAEQVYYTSSLNRFKEFILRQGFYGFRHLPILIFLIFGFIKKISKPVFFYFLSLILLLNATMIVVPLYAPRSAIISFIVTIAFAIYHIDFSKIRNKWTLYLLAILSICLFAEKLPIIKGISERSKINYNKLESLEGTQDTVYINRTCYSWKYSSIICDDFSDTPNLEGNEIMEEYYNIKSIGFKRTHSVNYRAALQKKDGSLATYDLQEENLYTKKNDEGGMEVIFRSDEMQDPENYFLSIRGSKKGFHRHRLLDYIPIRMRQYFLDYKEHQEPFYNKQGNAYAYDYIFDSQDYSYFIINIYSKLNHAPLGQPIIYETKD